MNVRDINEFLDDIGEYDVKEVKRKQGEKGTLRYLIVVMANPITQVEQELRVNAWYNKEKDYDMHTPNQNLPAIQVGGREWYELTYNPDKQDESIDDDAKLRLHKLMFNGEKIFDDVIDIPYEYKIRHGGK